MIVETGSAVFRDPDWRGLRLAPSQTIMLQEQARVEWQRPWAAQIYEAYASVQRKRGINCLIYGVGARAAQEARTIAGARVYWTSEEMEELALHAAKDMPDEPLLEIDPPCPTGLFFLERSVGVPMMNGLGYPLRAFAWTVLETFWRKEDGGMLTRRGVLFSYYADGEDTDAARPDLAVIGRPAARLGFCLDVFDEFEEPERTMEEEANAVGATMDEMALTRVRTRRLPRALWTLSKQKLACVEPRGIPRQQRRALERSGSPIRPEVLEVRLRNATHAAERTGSHPVEWTRRWMVSGHWRRQWLPSVKGHRLQFIAPFIKGPPDKPLVLPKKIHELVR